MRSRSSDNSATSHSALPCRHNRREGRSALPSQNRLRILILFILFILSRLF
jgi:hypothetical protein